MREIFLAKISKPSSNVRGMEDNLLCKMAYTGDNFMYL